MILQDNENQEERHNRMAEKFASLPDCDKSFIAGYMAKAEEQVAAGVLEQDIEEVR